jgi:hypothetical protein
MTSDPVILNIVSNDTLRYIDSGRRPGKQPPAGPLGDWAERKGIKIGKNKKSAGFVIAHSIGKKGIHPTDIIDKAIDQAIQNKSNLFSDALADDIWDSIKNTFE